MPMAVRGLPRGLPNASRLAQVSDSAGSNFEAQSSRPGQGVDYGVGGALSAFWHQVNTRKQRSRHTIRMNRSGTQALATTFPGQSLSTLSIMRKGPFSVPHLNFDRSHEFC